MISEYGPALGRRRSLPARLLASPARRLDWVLILAVLALSLIGSLLVFSATRAGLAGAGRREDQEGADQRQGEDGEDQHPVETPRGGGQQPGRQGPPPAERGAVLTDHAAASPRSSASPVVWRGGLPARD